MSDINLLPKDLRGGEAQERKAPPAPPTAPRYSVPARSQLQDRLESLQPDAGSLNWWGKVKQWFMKPPTPAPVVPIPLEKPGFKKPMQSFRLAKPEPKSPFLSAGVKGKVQLPSLPPAAVPPQPSVVKDIVLEKPVERPKPKPKEDQNVTPETEEKGPASVPLGVVLDVNLLPTDERPAEDSQGHSLKLGVVAAVAVVVVGVGYLVLSMMMTKQQDRSAKVRQEGQALALQITGFRKDLAMVEAAGQKILAIRKLLQNRHNWLTFLSQLEALTLSNVRFSNASVTPDGLVSLNAEGLTLTDLAQQLKVFQTATNVFSDVSVGTFSSSNAAADNSAQGSSLARTSFQLQLASGWEQANSSPAPLTETPAAASQ